MKITIIAKLSLLVLAMACSKKNVPDVAQAPAVTTGPAITPVGCCCAFAHHQCEYRCATEGGIAGMHRPAMKL
jgi:hypothetical protein